MIRLRREEGREGKFENMSINRDFTNRNHDLSVVVNDRVHPNIIYPFEVCALTLPNDEHHCINHCKIR